MEKMISVETAFQYSVNIAYDLNRDEKLINFIPTPSSLRLLEEILLSTDNDSTDRARILIGAYGKGKSHIVLVILSMLMQRDRRLFTKLLGKAKENAKLYQLIHNYFDSGKKLLPVIISGSSTNIPQAFLLALERTLTDYNLMDIMPETNYKAAEGAINRWEKEFPETYAKFEKQISMPINVFRKALLDFDTSVYEEFEKIYPTLTSGSSFNPFLGFDVVELYESVVKSLKSRGYSGIYVVYDEFSKYLETNITKATISDTKMLQDFAEKCCRSGGEQLHLLLISHKDISNYIDKLPKQKVDGWRGVSERFKHIYLNNNFARTYEIISNVIVKEKDQWEIFRRNNSNYFGALSERYKEHSMFTDDSDAFEEALYGCFPLHPVSTYILPRLSELVAQNERTLFSFLSANEENTLKRYLERDAVISFNIVTPDLVFDYFEPQIRKEIYAEDIHEIYVLTRRVLEKLEKKSLESKIVKTISLIYILSQFEKLAPTRQEIIDAYSPNYQTEEIGKAIENLITHEYVVYLKRSNNFLCLKQTSGVDIKKEIANTIAQQTGTITVKQVLNSINFTRYMYPSRYNDEREMTRYFSFKFIDEEEVAADVNWKKKSENAIADGQIYGVLIKSEENIKTIKEMLLQTSKTDNRSIFILPKDLVAIKSAVYEYNAVESLQQKAGDDTVLFDEYEVVYEDLQDVITEFINGYTQPEKYKALFIHNGTEPAITRKADLSDLMSRICDVVYSETPVINNEAINKNKPTSMAVNSRNKIIAGLLRNELENNLGLIGSGQEVSIMRSTLIRTGILVQESGITKINLKPADNNVRYMLTAIIDFIREARTIGSASFNELYNTLMGVDAHIGLRRGVIPIYLAAVLHEMKKDLIIHDSHGVVEINAETLLQINAKPMDFVLIYLNWSPEKEKLVVGLSRVFNDYIVDTEKEFNTYNFAFLAMKRWYLGLPKYTKEARQALNGKNINITFVKFLKLLKQADDGSSFLFRDLPSLFNDNDIIDEELLRKIQEAKDFYDKFIQTLTDNLIISVKKLFVITKNREHFSKLSLSSVVKDWCETLNPNVFEQLFDNGTDKCLNLFKNISHNENAEIIKLARLATGLRLVDWDDNTYAQFIKRLKLYKVTAERFVADTPVAHVEKVVPSQYQLAFADDEGKIIIKRFERVETTPRGRLLFNNLAADIEAMGSAISEQEKRQILMDILKGMC